MTAEERIMEAQNKKPPTKRETSRRNWIMGIVLTLCTLIAVFSFLFAMIQLTEAKKQTALAIKIMEENVLLRKENEQLKQVVVAAQDAIEKQKQVAIALTASQSSKK